MINSHRQYFNNLAPQWKELMPEDDSLITYLKRLGVQPGETILDAGAGTGRMTIHIIDLVGTNGHVIVQDIAEDMLKCGKEDQRLKEVLWLCDDLTNMSIQNNVFDKIICFSMFPHIQNPEKALQECYRTLKPNGKLLILHTCDSKTLNSFHATLNTPVNEDRLLPVKKMAELIKKSGLNIQHLEETPSLYWVEAQKTN